MRTFVYDGSFEGLMSVVFEAYRLKINPEQIVMEELWQPSFFGSPIHVETKGTNAQRVIQGIENRCGKEASTLLYHAFLSEVLQVEMLIFQFVQMAFDQRENVLHHYGHPVVLKLHQLKKQIHREEHRMHAFVRFQEIQGQLFAAVVEPDFNILPLLPPHFSNRFPAFKWLIFDRKRHFGIYHEDHQVRFVTLKDVPTPTISQKITSSNEKNYQHLWQVYFQSVDIPERRNMKLHLQHVPRRYWKYLIEKQA